MGVRIAGDDSSAPRRDRPPLRHWVFAPLRWARRLWQGINTHTVDLKEAEAHIDELVEEAEHGRPFTISVDGKPMVKVSHIDKEELDRLPRVDE